MCGIVGHIGPSNSVQVVVEGLGRLEYRGYDSAGVSYLDRHGSLRIIKKEGMLDKLRSVLGDLSGFEAFSCIGHTRWATHGEVNDANSHPHTDGRISVVHNGIIENSDRLKEEIGDYTFKSATDSEVFLALVTGERERGMNLVEGLAAAFRKIEGNSAFVIIDGEGGDIFAVKRGAPLVCGIHEVGSEALVSSDPYALVGISDKLYFPEDGVICHLSAGNKNLINFYELDRSLSKRYLSRKQEISLETTDKGGFEHFMLKEIHEQPGLIRGLTGYYLDGEGVGILEDLASMSPNRFLIVACGTAYYAGMLVRDFIERHNRINCCVDLASEFRYRNPLLDVEDIGLFISQSGETADTLAAQFLCKEALVETVSIVNVEESTLYRNCQKNLVIRAGIEIGVASTKAFTQQALTGRLLSFAMGGGLGNRAKREALRDIFHLLAKKIDSILGRMDEIRSIARSIHGCKGFFFTGRGTYYPVALEGALKLKEITYVHAEGYAAGELKHGPIALIDETMVNIAIVGPELRDKTLSNMEEVRARKGVIVAIGPMEDAELRRKSDHFFPLDFAGLGDLAPLYVNVFNQLLAYCIAEFKGTDIDKPRNLAKSVTVE